MNNRNSNEVLIICHDENLVNQLKQILNGYKVLLVTKKNSEIGALLENSGIKILILYLENSETAEICRLKRLKNECESKNIPIIVTIEYLDAINQPRILEAGASDIFIKNSSTDKLISIVENLTQLQKIKCKCWTKVSYNIEEGDEYQGRSEATSSLMKEIYHIAKLDSNVLIIGEQGTGKELVARILHKYSNRKDSLFISFDCFGLSRDQLMRDLWGCEERFPRVIGCAREANGGILFLDEIGVLEEEIQWQIIRFIEKKEVWPVDSAIPVEVDARIISTTRFDINDAIGRNIFLPELYYKLGEMTIRVPPIRERKDSNTKPKGKKLGETWLTHDDIELLVDYAIKRYNTSMGMEKIQGIEISALELLKDFEWPGNVRHLNNVINYAASMASSRGNDAIITEEDIRNTPSYKNFIPFDYEMSIIYKGAMAGNKKMKREFAEKMKAIMILADNDISTASELIGISEAILRKYAKAYWEIWIDEDLRK